MRGYTEADALKSECSNYYTMLMNYIMMEQAVLVVALLLMPLLTSRLRYAIIAIFMTPLLPRY